MRYLFYIILGYLSGSILYAYLIPYSFCSIDICDVSDDGNPGTANAFKYAGFTAGCSVILLELLKAFLPVFLAMKQVDPSALPFALVMAAPVLGHAFPFFYLIRFLMKGKDFVLPLKAHKGGKAIAASLGVVLALFPMLTPLLALAFFYIFFSTVIVIRPHLYRSILTFCCFALTVFLEVPLLSIRLGALLISMISIGKHLAARQEEKLSVSLLGIFPSK